MVVKVHSDEDFQFAKRMIAWGLNDCQVSRLVGINRVTIRDWRTGKVSAGDGIAHRNACPRCGHGKLITPSYAYLLGLYLGDGCIASCPRNVFKLRISLDNRYPRIIDSCRQSNEELLVNKSCRREQWLVWGVLRCTRIGSIGRACFLNTAPVQNTFAASSYVSGSK